jgi:putative oxidoreductase
MSAIDGFASRRRFVGLVETAYSWLERVPYWFLALPLRVAVAWIFWSSAMTHLSNWQATLSLFATDYRLPFLPPVPAAYIAVSIEVGMLYFTGTMELVGGRLITLGLFTRPATLVLLGMTAVIEIFVYPQAWPTHIQWAAMLLVLLCRGPGQLSLDGLFRRLAVNAK